MNARIECEEISPRENDALWLHNTTNAPAGDRDAMHGVKQWGGVGHGGGWFWFERIGRRKSSVIGPD